MRKARANASADASNGGHRLIGPSDNVLIYETDDSGFADSVIDALMQAGIECYRTGGALLYTPSESTVCIHIRNAADSQRANEILIQQGAAVDRPRSISPVVIVAAVLVAVLVALWVVRETVK